MRVCSLNTKELDEMPVVVSLSTVFAEPLHYSCVFARLVLYCVLFFTFCFFFHHFYSSVERACVKGEVATSSCAM